MNKAKELGKNIISRGKEVGCEEEKEEDVVDEMELGELDMDEIEKECDKQGRGYVSRTQLESLQEAIIKAKSH